ncbi:MAG: hypothetical protein M0Z28_31660 [Rhodospirillales bacterium]|nr:hypothetical protein [Rhodospirillales bacterium]
MYSEPELSPSRPRRHRRGAWLPGVSAVLVIVALLAVWAVLAAHG